MFAETMDRITSEFAARVIGALREASIAELAARRARAPKKVAAPRAAVRTVTKRGGTATPPKRAALPDRVTTDAALDYFVARGSKGATAEQLVAHFTELGASAASVMSGVVIEALVAAGSIRDAGFRRSTGTGNKTTSVFVVVR
jgi:hypothetical protein